MSISSNIASVEAANAAINAHKNALNIEGDAECQLWHLLVSLQEYCAVFNIDFNATLQDVRSELPSLNLSAWEASRFSSMA